MIKFETRRSRWKRPDLNKCALVAAMISAVVMAGVGLSGSALSGAHAGPGGTLKPQLETNAAATAPVATPR